MKKNDKFMRTLYSISFTVVALLMAGCAKETAPEETMSNKVRIQAGLNEESRVSLTDNTTTLALAWEADDAIRINGASGSSLFEIVPGYTDHNASFEGNALFTGPYTLIFPGSYTSADALEARDFSAQTQNGNGSTAHLEYNALLSGVSDYHSFAFTSSWAAANSASFQENAVLKLQLQVPSGIASVSRLVLSSNSEVFYKTNGGSQKTNTLTLNLENVSISPEDCLLTVYFDLSMQAAKFLSSTALTATLTTNIGVYSKLIMPGAKTLAGGKMYVINFNDGNWTSTAPFAGGNGTEATPYLISNYLHMNNIGSMLSDGETVWFEMISDVDMNPNDAGYWTPLNTVSPYAQAVHFDGKGHSIKNFTINGGTQHNGMFAILNGTVQNVTFQNPKIIDNSYTETTNHDVGFVTGFCGFNSGGNTYPGIVSNVHIQNGEISTSSKLHTGGVGFGAITGTAAYCTIADCTVDGFTITDYGSDGSVPNIMGGIAGRTTSAVTTIERCAVTNLNLTGYSYIGGILAYHNSPNLVTIRDCSTSGTFTGYQYLGGIVGGAAKSAVNLTLTGLTSSVNMTSLTATTYMGGIMGGHNTAVTISNSSASGTLSAASGLGAYTGGIIGYTKLDADNPGTTTLTGCRFTGSINVGKGYVGGIIGATEQNAVISDCGCSATIAAADVRQGGIVGSLGALAYTSLISDCWFSGELKSNRSNSSDASCYAGGIVGAGYNATLRRCLSTGKIGCNNHDTVIGGLAAYFNKCDVQACAFTGSFPQATTNAGGLIGGIVGAVTVSNCYVDANVTGTYTIGGLISYSTNSANNTQTVSNNLVLNKQQGVIAVGGILGRMSRTSGNFICSGNLVYSTSITSTRSKDCNTYRSSGTIIGECDGTAYTLNNTNYFSSSLGFTDGASGVSDRVTTPTEQTGTYTTSNPLTWSYTATYFQPYYGRKTTATASAQASTIGWDTSVWDLGGSTPTLKNLPTIE